MDTYIKSQFVELDDAPFPTTCLLCDDKFVLPTNEQDFLTHLFKEHQLVIGDVWKIASLKSYIRYWGMKFKTEPLTTYCTTLLMDCMPDGKPSKNEAYFLLSDCTLEDKTLRDELHRAKLVLRYDEIIFFYSVPWDETLFLCYSKEWVLSEQSKERIDTNFERGCLFCKMEFHGSRIEYIRHLSQKHNFHIGKPENLVFLDELLNKIQTTIEGLICIYCEKVFKDRVALKEHMRKKLHKRINPTNKGYDKYYINNYLEPGRSWKQKQLDRNEQENTNELSSENEDEETTWSDWNDENAGISCLFCVYSDKNFSAIIDHLKDQHNFDFQEITKNLTFYQKIKVVNYVRQQMHLQCCILCEATTDNILSHMQEHGHYKLPEKKVWDQPQFYFPMNESDSFLYHLDASDNSDEEGVQCIGEKITVIQETLVSREEQMSNKKYCTPYLDVKAHYRNNDCSQPKAHSFVNDNDLVRFRIDGIFTTTAFQRACLLVEKLYRHLPFKFAPPQIRGMLQVDWHDHLRKLRLRIGGKLWQTERHVAVFVNDEFLGNDADLLHYISQSYIFNLPVDLEYYESLVAEKLKDYIEKSKRTYVYFTLSMDGSIIGSLLFMLYTDLMPLTCQYFMNLCFANNEKWHDKIEPYYVNTLIHRVVKSGWIQCGKPQVHSHETTASIVSLPDESYCIPHNRLGVLSLTNDGKHCNKPQFVVCLKANPWMNYYYTAFGQLVDGIKLLRKLENMKTYYEAPVKQIVIAECGEYYFGEELKLETDADVFLVHQPESEGEGEYAMSHNHLWSDDSDICFLDNVIDQIDVRDVPSLLMAEKYLRDFSRLSVDPLTVLLEEPDKELTHPTCDLNIRELLQDYHPNKMTAEEKRTFIYKMFRLILSCILHSTDNEFCLDQMSLNITGEVQKIFRIAHETAIAIIAKTPNHECSLVKAEKQLNEMLEENPLESEECVACPAIIEKILKNAITNLISSTMAE